MSFVSQDIFDVLEGYANMLARAGADITAMGVTADLIKVLERIH